ncbi:hypothetical protein PG987_004000 [Apiospora arundinis]
MYDQTVQDISPQIEVLSMLQNAISLASFRNIMNPDNGALLQAHGIAHLLRTKISRLGYASSQTELITLDTDNEAAVQHAQQMYQAWSTMSRNRHFPDRAHANTYVGHEEQLKKIEDALDQRTTGGVFWVDASSRDTAEQSYITLAKEFGENLTEQAAKQFLSSRELIHPWLLIIDNADDHDLSLEELSPTGDKDSIFVTTRNQEHIGYGNAGSRSLELNKMENEDAKELLLTTAEEPRRTEGILGKSTTTKREGSQADLCGHENMSATARDKEAVSNALQLLQMFSFIHFYNIRLDMLLQASINPLHEKDVQNEIESRESEIINRLGLQTESTRPWLKSKIRDLVSNCFLPALLPELLKNPNNLISDQLIPKVLPRLRNAPRFLAPRSLINKITSEKEDAIDDDRPLLERYKMHPLVHKWVRDRPGLKVSERAMHCQMASSVLASCIPLAGDDSDHDITLHREMKPHIEEVRKCSVGIQAVTREANSKRQNKAWWTIDWLGRKLGVCSEKWVWPWYEQMKLGEKARFGKVYLECANYEEAGSLLSEVHDHLTHLANSGLAIAFFHQTRRNDSEKLLSEVHESRKRLYGPKHPRTLDTAVLHAEGILAKGRFTNSLEMCKEALGGLREAFGAHDKKTIQCMSLIGKIYSFKFEYIESIRWLRKALQDAMEEPPGGGPGTLTLPEILDIKEALAMSFMNACTKDQDVESRERDLTEPEDLMELVVRQRKEIWSESHPFTLLGKAYHGRVIAARGSLEEAEHLMKDTLKTALLVLGDEHLGILAGKKWYGEVLMQRGKLDQAERYLREACDRSKYQKAAGSDCEHPGRINHVWALILCLERQDKLAEAMELCRQLKHDMPLVGRHGLETRHVINDDLDKKIDSLEARLGSTF